MSIEHQHIILTSPIFICAEPHKNNIIPNIIILCSKMFSGFRFRRMYCLDRYQMCGIRRRIEEEFYSMVNSGNVSVRSMYNALTILPSKYGLSVDSPVNIFANQYISYVPTYTDTHPLPLGIQKLDLGLTYKGAYSDFSFCFDNSGNPTNKLLVDTAHDALWAGIDYLHDTINQSGVSLNGLVSTLKSTIEDAGVFPMYTVYNGHTLSRITVNYQFFDYIHTLVPDKITYGLIAVEPFVSEFNNSSYSNPTGSGRYQVLDPNDPPRNDVLACKVLSYIVHRRSQPEQQPRYPNPTKVVSDIDIYNLFGLAGVQKLAVLVNNGNLASPTYYIEPHNYNIAKAERTVYIYKERIKVI